MSNTNLNTFRTDHAIAELNLHASGDLTLAFSGTIDNPRPEPFLEPIFAALDQGAEEHKAPRVIVDLTALNFLNSSGIKTFANWLKRQLAIAEGKRPQIDFSYSEQVTWQRATVKALSTMSGGRVTATAV